MKATSVIPWSRVSTKLVFWGWVGVIAEVSSFKWGLCLHAGITAGLDFWDATEDVIEAQAVPNLMDHGVSVSRNAIERWVQDNATCKGETRALGNNLLQAKGVLGQSKTKGWYLKWQPSLLYDPTAQRCHNSSASHWLPKLGGVPWITLYHVLRENTYA